MSRAESPLLHLQPQQPAQRALQVKSFSNQLVSSTTIDMNIYRNKLPGKKLKGIHMPVTASKHPKSSSFSFLIANGATPPYRASLPTVFQSRLSPKSNDAATTVAVAIKLNNSLNLYQTNSIPSSSQITIPKELSPLLPPVPATLPQKPYSPKRKRLISSHLPFDERQPDRNLLFQRRESVIISFRNSAERAASNILPNISIIPVRHQPPQPNDSLRMDSPDNENNILRPRRKPTQDESSSSSKPHQQSLLIVVQPTKEASPTDFHSNITATTPSKYRSVSSTTSRRRKYSVIDYSAEAINSRRPSTFLQGRRKLLGEFNASTTAAENSSKVLFEAAAADFSERKFTDKVTLNSVLDQMVADKKLRIQVMRQQFTEVQRQELNQVQDSAPPLQANNSCVLNTKIFDQTKVLPTFESKRSKDSTIKPISNYFYARINETKRMRRVNIAACGDSLIIQERPAPATEDNEFKRVGSIKGGGELVETVRLPRVREEMNQFIGSETRGGQINESQAIDRKLKAAKRLDGDLIVPWTQYDE